MISEELRRLESEGKSICIGVHGAGWMGSGFVTAVRHVPGLRVAVLSDPDVGKARDVLIACGVDGERITEVSTPGEAEDALSRGKTVVTDDCTFAGRIDSVDVVTDVTPSPASGAETAYSGIRNGKDVVLVNIEADVTVGRVLKKLAREQHVLYSVSSGDEPGCLMELWDFVTSLGYEPVVIGKGKNNPLQPDATPDTVADAASRQDKDPYQVASYVDGTKTMFEMTCAANATGCLPVRRGMMGPEADLESVPRVFALKVDGGITPAPYTVDFVQGNAMAGGVFITVRIQDERIRKDLQYLKVGSGKYFTFFRPYHLWFLEAPISFARASLHRQPTLVPLDEPVAEVLTVAKRTLEPGEKLDDFGGYTFHGMIDRSAEAAGALPVGLGPGARVTRKVWKGKVISYDDVELDESSTVVKLRRMQDDLQESKPAAH